MREVALASDWVIIATPGCSSSSGRRCWSTSARPRQNFYLRNEFEIREIEVTPQAECEIGVGRTHFQEIASFA